MATVRMMPPANGATTRVNGRSYTAAAGATIDVPDFDASVLEANGWIKNGAASVGATAARPLLTNTKADIGKSFHDSTLGYNIVWDGKNWRNPTSGASV